MGEYREVHEYREVTPEQPTVPVVEQRVVDYVPVTPPVQRVETVETVVTGDTRLGRIVMLIYYAFGILESLLFIRFVLRLMGANPNSPFAVLMYSLTQPFLFLFEGLLPTPRAGGSAVEFITLVAIIIYALLAFAIVRLIRLMYSRYPA